MVKQIATVERFIKRVRHRVLGGLWRGGVESLQAAGQPHTAQLPECVCEQFPGRDRRLWQLHFFPRVPAFELLRAQNHHPQLVDSAHNIQLGVPAARLVLQGLSQALQHVQTRERSHSLLLGQLEQLRVQVDNLLDQLGDRSVRPHHGGLLGGEGLRHQLPTQGAQLKKQSSPPVQVVVSHNHFVFVHFAELQSGAVGAERGAHSWPTMRRSGRE